jgi:molybdenum-dependent DNA-binding transcriptional regulator ModE
MPTNKTKASTRKSRQREQLVLALMQQPSLQKAAASIGISAVTAWRISKTAEFQEEYRLARREAVQQSFGRLQQGSGAAATILMKIMLDPANPAASRVRAADRVMQHSQSHLETEDFEQRLRRLEEAAAENCGANIKPSW